MGFKFSAQKGSRLTILRLPHTPPLFNKLSFDNGIEYERIKLVLEKVRCLQEKLAFLLLRLMQGPKKRRLSKDASKWYCFCQ